MITEILLTLAISAFILGAWFIRPKEQPNGRKFDRRVIWTDKRTREEIGSRYEPLRSKRGPWVVKRGRENLERGK